MTKKLVAKVDEAPMIDIPRILFGNHIRKDRDERYCLNDIHQAAGGEERHKPSRWLRYTQAKEMEGLINSGQVIDFTSKNSTEGPKKVSAFGRKAGRPRKVPLAVAHVKVAGVPLVFVHKKMVYLYAMWISVEFSNMVLEVFDRAATLEIREQYARDAVRQITRDEYSMMIEAIDEVRASQNKPPKQYIYTNYANMINVIVTGSTAKKLAVERGFSPDAPTREYMVPGELEAIKRLQQLVSFTIEDAEGDYYKVQGKCQAEYNRRFKARCDAERAQYSLQRHEQD